MKRILSVILISAFSLTTFAHEGHDGPSGLQAPHGGVAKPGKQINLELVQEGSSIKLYPISHEGKALDTKTVTLKATAKIPKKGKNAAQSKALTLKAESEGFSSEVDMKGSHRFELEVEAASGGKTDKFTFQVEPQG